MEWQEIVAFLIQGVGVVLLVQYLKNFGMSWLKVNAPWSLPIIAMFAAQVLNGAAAYLGTWLGYPIDFSAIIAILIGASAVVSYDIAHAARK